MAKSSGTFSFVRDEREGITLLVLSGVIDEENQLEKVLENSPTGLGVALISTRGVTRINSVGVRDWIKWLESVEACGWRCYFVEVSPTMMMQVNVVSNFLSRGEILSLEVPYFCGGCDNEAVVLLDAVAARQEPQPFVPPPRQCDVCGREAEFDDAESYFDFLHRPRHGEETGPELARRHRILVSMADRVFDDLRQPPGERDAGDVGASEDTVDLITNQSTPAATVPNASEFSGLITDNSGMGVSRGSNRLLYLIILLIFAVMLLLIVYLSRAW